MAENDAPERGITIQQALEMATESELDILSILMRGGSIKTNRGMLEAARLINKHFRLDTCADLAAPATACGIDDDERRLPRTRMADPQVVDCPDCQQVLIGYKMGRADAVRQARAETWESAARVVEAFNNWARWADGNIKPIASQERIAAALRAEGEKGASK